MQNTNRGRRGALVHTTSPHTNINTHTHTYTRQGLWKNHRLTGVKMKLQYRE